MTVDLEGTPVFDWEPGSAFAVEVYEVDENGEQADYRWSVWCGGEDGELYDSLETVVCLETPLVYGEALDSPYLDPYNFVAPQELERGQTYRVSIVTMTEDGGGSPPDVWHEHLTDWLPDRGDRPTCGSTFVAAADFVLP